MVLQFPPGQSVQASIGRHRLSREQFFRAGRRRLRRLPALPNSSVLLLQAAAYSIFSQFQSSVYSSGLGISDDFPLFSSAMIYVSAIEKHHERLFSSANEPERSGISLFRKSNFYSVFRVESNFSLQRFLPGFFQAPWQVFVQSFINCTL